MPRALEKRSPGISEEERGARRRRRADDGAGRDDGGVGVFLLGLKRGHRARGASSDNQDVAVEALGVVRDIIHGQIPLSVEV